MLFYDVASKRMLDKAACLALYPEVGYELNSAKYNKNKACKFTIALRFAMLDSIGDYSKLNRFLNNKVITNAKMHVTNISRVKQHALTDVLVDVDITTKMTILKIEELLWGYNNLEYSIGKGDLSRLYSNLRINTGRGNIGAILIPTEMVSEDDLITFRNMETDFDGVYLSHLNYPDGALTMLYMKDICPYVCNRLQSDYLGQGFKQVLDEFSDVGNAQQKLHRRLIHD